MMHSSPKENALTRFLNSRKVVPYIMASPFIISFLVFFLYPILYSGQMSFYAAKGFGPPQFSGLNNYKMLYNDYFFKSIANSAQYTLLTCLVLIPMPLIFASILNSGTVKKADLVKSAMFIPALTSVVMAGLFFRYAFSSNENAIFNGLIKAFGFPPQNWLEKQPTTMAVLVTFCSWKWMGVNIIYYFSALQSVPGELYESAKIDGANVIQQFLYVTVPSVRATIIYVLTISIYGGFSMFAESYTLFNNARTPGDIGSTIVGYIYNQGIHRNDFGLASAAGIVLLGIVLIFNVLQLFLTGSFRKEAR
ncbi:MAG: sugar ABC transporter permease [Clostridiales bacterium]|nr:sugar ABC transporter permease [Clostridiales bacterium]